MLKGEVFGSPWYASVSLRTFLQLPGTGIDIHGYIWNIALQEIIFKVFIFAWFSEDPQKGMQYLEEGWWVTVDLLGLRHTITRSYFLA